MDSGFWIMCYEKLLLTFLNDNNSVISVENSFTFQSPLFTIAGRRVLFTKINLIFCEVNRQNKLDSFVYHCQGMLALCGSAL